MDEKWYSNGLTDKDVKGLKKCYAKIVEPFYGVNDRNILALQFSLNCEGRYTGWQLIEPKDIKALLTKTKAYDVSKLEGKVIEVFRDGNMLRGLSVDENLI